MLKRNILIGLFTSASTICNPILGTVSCHAMEAASQQKQSVKAGFEQLMNSRDSLQWDINLEDVKNIKEAITNVLGVNQQNAEKGINAYLIPAVFKNEFLTTILDMPVRVYNTVTNENLTVPFSVAAGIMAAQFGEGKYKAHGLQKSKPESDKFVICSFTDASGTSKTLTSFGLMYSIMQYADAKQPNSPIAQKIRNNLAQFQQATAQKSTTTTTTTVKSQSGNLISYITAFSAPQEVITLAEVGYKNYAPGSKLSNARLPGGKKAGGRTLTWIEDTFGQGEAEIIAQLQTIPAPQTWTLNDIDQAYQTEIQKHPSTTTTPPTFTMVKGLSVNDLHDQPLGKNSILQLASQFNYLESPGAYLANVANYLTDPTQGPQGSIEAAAAALHRTAAVKAGSLQHSLINVLPSDSQGYYKNGYLELFKVNDLSTLQSQIAHNIGKLGILAQWVICEPSNTRQLQVFAAAPSFQGKPIPPEGSPAAQICDLLVSAQYEAIAKLAVIQSVENPGQPINVHLTLVGQGAFNNPRSVMTSAFAKVASIVQGFPNVHIYIHGYGPGDQNIIRAASSNANLLEMTKEDFMNAQ